MGCLWVNQYSVVPARKSQASVKNNRRQHHGKHKFVICSCKFFSKALLYFSINHCNFNSLLGKHILAYNLQHFLGLTADKPMFHNLGCQII
jgi:hypothetical protein